MGLSSAGIGSNLDVDGIVSKLMSVEQQPLTRMAKQETSYQAKLTGFGTLKGAIAQFQTSVRALADISKFQAVKSSVVDSSVATVTSTSSATPGNYALQVTQLAHTQKLVAAGVASDTAQIGKGTITFDFGTMVGGTLGTDGKYTGTTSFDPGSLPSKTVNIDGASSLADIRDAINAAGVGVTAAIVNDGGTSPYRLTLTGQNTGEASSVKITVAEDPASPGLAALLTHNPLDPANGLKETATAVNAKFTIDGIAVSKASNTVTDVLNGVTLNLVKENPGSTTSINVARDTGSVSNAVTAFVKAYNDISQTLRDAMAYNSTTKTAAILNGEASVRAIQTQVRAVLSAPVNGGVGALTRLSQIGVTVQKDGLLAVDSTKLTTALGSNFADFARLFAAPAPAADGTPAPASSLGYAAQFDRLATALLSSDGPLAGRTDGINASIKALTKQEDALRVRLVGVEKRYRAQFTSLDTAISSMNTTSSYLTQQLTQIANMSKL